MKLTSLKLKPKNRLRETMSQPVLDSPADDGPVYPWGLELNLETETIDKLGIDIENVRAGDTVHIVAKAEITSVTVRQSANKQHGDEGTNKSLSLQLTAMQLGGSKDSLE
jgi:hypothetical protein